MIGLDKDYEEELIEMGIPFIKSTKGVFISKRNFEVFQEEMERRKVKAQKPMSRWRDYETDYCQ